MSYGGIKTWGIEVWGIETWGIEICMGTLADSLPLSPYTKEGDMDCHAKIVPGENCTTRYNFCNQYCTGWYNFGCEKCTGLAKSISGSEKGPLALTS